ncbi:hypothetical protein B0H19DRAFT_1194359, partial [Mycena capillaripes]
MVPILACCFPHSSFLYVVLPITLPSFHPYGRSHSHVPINGYAQTNVLLAGGKMECTLSRPVSTLLSIHFRSMNLYR